MKINIILICLWMNFSGLAQIPPKEINRAEIFRSIIPKTQIERREFAERRYTGCYGDNLGQNVWKTLESISPKYLVLIGDIGIIQSLSQFKKFAQEKNNTRKKNFSWKKIFFCSGNLFVDENPILKNQKDYTFDPEKMRDLFSKSLGYSLVYRGLALTENELAEIKNKGISSQQVLTLQRNFELYDPKESYNNIQNILRGRLHRNARNDYFMSVSKKPRVAEAVANMYLAESKKVYLFEIKIPNLYNIHALPVKKYPQSPFAINSCILYHPETESFVPYIIEKDEIQNILTPADLSHFPPFDGDLDILDHPEN